MPAIETRVEKKTAKSSSPARLLLIIGGSVVVGGILAAIYLGLIKKPDAEPTPPAAATQPAATPGTRVLSTFSIEKLPPSPFAPASTSASQGMGGGTPPIPNGIFNVTAPMPQVRGVVSSAGKLMASLSVGSETITVEEGEKTKFGTVGRVTKEGIYLNGEFVPLRAAPPQQVGGQTTGGQTPPIPSVPGNLPTPVFQPPLPKEEGGR